MTPENLPYAETFYEVNEVRLQVAVAGAAGRPLAMLLHGFPDLWQGWHHQIGMLEAAGFRVLAPNQRGYGKSDKPQGLSAYDLDLLADDVLALADAEQCSQFCLVGHDWGGIVAWWIAAKHPARVKRLVILNAPHPGVLKKYLLRNPRQLLRSWYVGFFQLPWLPEKMLTLGNYALLFRSIKQTSLPGVFDESDRRYLVAGWSQPGALTAMLNYYRAIARRSTRSLQQRVSLPTLILWGKHDPALEPGLAEASLAQCDNGRIVWLEDASHWIQREEVEQVNRSMQDFLCESPDDNRDLLAG